MRFDHRSAHQNLKRMLYEIKTLLIILLLLFSKALSPLTQRLRRPCMLKINLRKVRIYTLSAESCIHFLNVRRESLRLLHSPHTTTGTQAKHWDVIKLLFLRQECNLGKMVKNGVGGGGGGAFLRNSRPCKRSARYIFRKTCIIPYCFFCIVHLYHVFNLHL